MSASTIPKILVDLPPGFVGLPLTTSPETNAERAWVLAGRIASLAGQTQEELAGYLTSLVPYMTENNVRLFGRFAVGDANPVLVTLTLAIAPWSSTDVELVASNRGPLVAALINQYRQRRPNADLRTVHLPIGPTLLALEAGELRLPPEFTGRTEEVVRPALRAEFQTLTPDGEHLIVLGLTTGDESAWPLVAEQAIMIANSLRFDPVAE